MVIFLYVERSCKVSDHGVSIFDHWGKLVYQIVVGEHEDVRRALNQAFERGNRDVESRVFLRFPYYLLFLGKIFVRVPGDRPADLRGFWEIPVLNQDIAKKACVAMLATLPNYKSARVLIYYLADLQMGNPVLNLSEVQSAVQAFLPLPDSVPPDFLPAETWQMLRGL